MLLEGEKTPAQILSRCTVGGDYYNHFNIKTVNGLEYNIDLERISTEHVMMSIIPRVRHGELECRKAKDTESKKLKDWRAYKIVKDVGQIQVITVNLESSLVLTYQLSHSLHHSPVSIQRLA